jgi:hypothetical protein
MSTYFTKVFKKELAAFSLVRKLVKARVAQNEAKR